MYRLDARGRILDADTSIYVDGFVIAGLTEYHAATQSQPALDLALATYENVSGLNRPGSYGVAPYEIPPGMKTHGVPMIFSFFFHELAKVATRRDIASTAAASPTKRGIATHFYVPTPCHP